MSKFLPTPTSQDIEAALTAIRNRTSAYGRYMRLEDSFWAVLIVLRDRTSVYGQWVVPHGCLDNQHKANAEADYLWWVNLIEPDGSESLACGGGTTSAEAAAVAWINNFIVGWWSKSGPSDQDYVKVPRHVPHGWLFELYEAPVRSVEHLKTVQGA